MLAVNQASLRAQTDGDYEQILMIDNDGIGIENTHLELSKLSDLRGEYVFMLDDDDKVIDPEFIATLKIVTVDQPELVIIKMRHQPDLVLPDDSHWRTAPVMGFIGCSAFVVRRDVWLANRQHFEPVYHGDFTFISAVYPQCKQIVWLDRIMTATQHGHNHGQPENIDPVAVSV